MHDQSISASAAPVLDGGLAAEDLGEHPVVVLSAAVLKAARTGHQASHDDFARRAGLPVAVVDGVERGTRPAWALSNCMFTALSAAISAVSPWMHGIFETATACDLLLSCVLDGDQVFATDVLITGETQELASALLRWAITGHLLSDVQVSLLVKRASALAVSGGPDAWVGARLLAISTASGEGSFAARRAGESE